LINDIEMSSSAWRPKDLNIYVKSQMSKAKNYYLEWMTRLARCEFGSHAIFVI
jgi:hypothetical protein